MFAVVEEFMIAGAELIELAEEVANLQCSVQLSQIL